MTGINIGDRVTYQSPLAFAGQPVQVIVQKFDPSSNVYFVQPDFGNPFWSWGHSLSIQEPRFGLMAVIRFGLFLSSKFRRWRRER